MFGHSDLAKKLKQLLLENADQFNFSYSSYDGECRVNAKEQKDKKSKFYYMSITRYCKRHTIEFRYYVDEYAKSVDLNKKDSKMLASLIKKICEGEIELKNDRKLNEAKQHINSILNPPRGSDGMTHIAREARIAELEASIKAINDEEKIRLKQPVPLLMYKGSR